MEEIRPDNSFEVIHEGKKQKDEYIRGRPDFKVEKNGLLIGYIETKPLGFNLDEMIRPLKPTRESKQLKNYLKVSDNLILTNYNEFILFKNGKVTARKLLFNLTDKSLDKNKIPDIIEVFNLFYLTSPEKIKNPEQLSELLAERTKIFRDYLEEFLDSEDKSDFKQRLIGDSGLLQIFKETLIEDLTLEEFIDAYVQTITYGLFLAELSSENSVTEGNATKLIPKSMGIIRELFKTLEIEDIPSSIGWIIEEIITILNFVDIEKLRKNLSFSKTYNYEDPYVYLYENFLGKYDQKKRKSKGVYYTPIPVVHFIIDSIDYLIKEHFDKDGLKGSDVKILDFATGTGTFILEAFKKALEGTDLGMRKNLIKERLLKNFYGFEYLIAPYTIAHLKLSQYLWDNGYELGDYERLKVFLTDTLDNTKHKEWSLLPNISKEGVRANQIKIDTPVLAVMGNPPYSNYSGGSGKEKKWIRGLLEDYKKGLNEKKINLDDDYIMFLRYAQWKIEQNGHGILGVITNNSYLDGITHKVMRKSLLDTFDQMYILDLHGNIRRGDPDQNVFDVMVGVSIVLFVKLPKKLETKEVYYFSTLENDLMKREEKYDFLLENDVSTLDWNIIKPVKNDYWFIKKDLGLENDYNLGWSVVEIFDEYNSGIQTGKDNLVIDFDRSELFDRVSDVLNSDNEDQIREKYNLVDTSGWNLKRFKKSLLDEKNIMKFVYRPFDTRWIFYTKNSLKRDRFKTMKNFLEINENLGLVFSRQIVEDKQFNHIFITKNLVDMRITLSNRGTGFVAPLYLNRSNKEAQSNFATPNHTNPYKNFDHSPNFSYDFIQFIIQKYGSAPSPEKILGYIYAVFYSKSYREKYDKFLKTDFPRIPFTDDYDKFQQLSELGNELILAHTLKKDYSNSSIARYPVEGDNLVDEIEYDADNQRIYINKSQYWENVPKDVWEMEIGGYKVLDKWLKYRKGRTLSFEDINHLQKVARSLEDTLSIMDEIDNIWINL
jgi:predicted helicase